MVAVRTKTARRCGERSVRSARAGRRRHRCGPAGDVLVTTARRLVIAYDPKTGQERRQVEGSYDAELTASTVSCGDGVGLVLAASEGLTALKVGGQAT